MAVWLNMMDDLQGTRIYHTRIIHVVSPQAWLMHVKLHVLSGSYSATVPMDDVSATTEYLRTSIVVYFSSTFVVCEID